MNSIARWSVRPKERADPRALRMSTAFAEAWTVIARTRQKRWPTAARTVSLIAICIAWSLKCPTSTVAIATRIAFIVARTRCGTTPRPIDHNALLALCVVAPPWCVASDRRFRSIRACIRAYPGQIYSVTSPIFAHLPRILHPTPPNPPPHTRRAHLPTPRLDPVIGRHDRHIRRRH